MSRLKHATRWENATKMKEKLTAGDVARFGDETLAVIVDTHLGAVQHHGTHDVGVNAAVETTHACEPCQKETHKL